MGPRTRLLTAERAFMAPYEPVRSDAFYTPAGQAAVLAERLRRTAEGTELPHVVLDDDGTPVGGITLKGIEHGSFRSCGLGYWVARHAGGRGLATQAVARMLDVAFVDLRLHRVQAETLLDNARSQRVLAKNGFERIGVASAYLHIAGRWQDHVLFQRLAPG